MTETVVVAGVTGPNDYGFYQVALEDGRETSTKNEAIAKHAEARVGASVEARISEVVKGRFTNIYLNEFDGIADPKRGRSNGAARATGAPQRASGGGGKSEATQERIARQWSYGRAVELLMASGEEFTLPLDANIQGKLQASADWLLEQTSK